MLTVIDLDVISKIKEIKKLTTYPKLRKTSTIMLMGDNINKNMVDNLKISYDYFFRKDKSFVLKKKEIICNAPSLKKAIENIKMHEEISDEEIYILTRNLELEEENNYQIFDLEDQFTDFYESESEIETFIKQIGCK